MQLSDGSSIRDRHAGVDSRRRAEPASSRSLGLPLDERGRIVVDPTLRVQGRDGHLGARRLRRGAQRGDTDPHRPADLPARPAAGPPPGEVPAAAPRPYRYKSLGEGATLGRDKGIARVFGVQLRGLLAATVIRWYHLRQVPLLSRRLRILADGTISALFRRDIAELGTIEPRRGDA